MYKAISSTRTRGSALDTSFRRSGRGEEDVEESDAVTVWRGKTRAPLPLLRNLFSSASKAADSGACAGSSALAHDINRVA